MAGFRIPPINIIPVLSYAYKLWRAKRRVKSLKSDIEYLRLENFVNTDLINTRTIELIQARKTLKNIEEEAKHDRA